MNKPKNSLLHRPANLLIFRVLLESDIMRRPKGIKTKKSVAKRFKITASGKVLRAQSSRRHLLSAKNAKRKRQLGKMARVDKTDEARVKANLPFG